MKTRLIRLAVMSGMVLGSLGCATTSPAASQLGRSRTVSIEDATARRADGECYMQCSFGYVCNHKTGLCDQGVVIMPSNPVPAYHR